MFKVNAHMFTTDGSEGLHLKLKVLHVVRLILSRIAKYFFRLYYGTKGEKIPPIHDDILKQPAIVVAKKIRDKEITSVEVIEACIRRIKDVNPALNCFVEDRFKAALQEAREADALVRGGSKTAADLEKEKPFLGVPFTTKDCMAVKGLHQTGGVSLRKGVIAKEDSDAVKLLRQNGAIVIGLTSVPELSIWWEARHHDHFHGRVKNAYNTTRIVGGSSGGEGCAQSTACSVFGIGSDIGGSIRLPSHFNGIFGHKPTRNTVSVKGQYPNPETDILVSFLGIGPMTRHAVDLKPLTQIIAGRNARKLNLDKPVDIKKIKFYYQISNDIPLVDPVDPEIISSMKRVTEFLKKKYDIVAMQKDIPHFRKAMGMWFIFMRKKKDWASGRYKRSLKLRKNLEKTISKLLANDGVLLFPTHPTTATYHNDRILRLFNVSYTGIINCLGLPSTTVPLGLSSEGLPIGIQVIANHNQDRLCFAVAEELDRAFGGWVEPQHS